jgi:MOB kinase activator 1
LFRVYAHIYYHHIKEIKELGLHRHLNTAFKHFILFSNEYKLISKDEQTPLKSIIVNLLSNDNFEF